MESIATGLVALVGFVGLPAAIAAGVGVWVVRLMGNGLSEKMKVAIKSEYDERLETLKASLKAASDVELERHKHALAIQAMQQNVQYARLHEKRAAVTGAAYSALSETYDALRAYTAAFEPVGGPTKDQRLAAVSAALKKFREAFVSQKVFLPRNVADQLDEIHRQMFTASNAFFWGVHFPPPDAAQTQKWIEITDRVDGPITNALRELEAEMRRLMGDDG